METSATSAGESWDIAVRAFLVPDATALARRRANRRRRALRPRPPAPTSDDHDDDASTSGDAAGQRAADEELQAITAVLGPRPWLTLILDAETRADPSQQLRA